MKAFVEVVKFDVNDVVTTSGGGSTGPAYCCQGLVSDD